LKVQLSATDYGEYLASESSGSMTTTTLGERCTAFYVHQFRYLRANAVQPLAQFLDYITYARCCPGIHAVMRPIPILGTGT
jgi:V-type H+-transporting ATPase subunit d